MSALSIQVPFPVFQDRDGQPLDNGYVWLGTSSLNPQTNPVVAYYDSALTIVATQPLRTLNGFISRAGSPAQVYVDAVNFSILVQDSKGTTVFSVPEGTGISPNASGVVYDPAGTGAVATTVQGKLRESVSVKDFGAVGDGVADDTIAIQLAIDSVKLLGGGVLSLPTGTYKITSSLSISGNFGYRGIKVVGNNSTLTSAENSPAIIVDAYATGGGSSAEGYRITAVIEDLYLVGPGVASTSSVGIKVQYSANVVIRDCVIRNFFIGLQGLGCLLSEFTNLQIHDNDIGISFTYSTTPVGLGSNDNHFNRCQVFDNRRGIFYSTGGGADVTFNGCEIEGNNLASVGIADGIAVIDLYVCGKVTFNGCYFELNKGQYNIKYSGWDATGSLNFIGCQFLLDGSTGYGVFLDNTVGVANSMTMIGSSVGTTPSGDLYIGTGFSATVINSPINSIVGTLAGLTRIAGGKLMSGSTTSTAAQILANGSANGSNVGLDVNGLLRLTDANGATRYGYVLGNLTSSMLLSDVGYAQLGTNGGIRVVVARLGTNTVEPNSDNNYNLGTASLRWGTVYAGTGAINTSDARAKQQIRSLSDAERDVAVRCKSLIRAFKFNDAVAEKGDIARTHFGVIAQDVKAAFEAEGLVAESYAIFCHDTWEEQEEIVAQDGTIERPHIADGDRYGIRYDQLLAFIIGAL